MKKIFCIASLVFWTNLFSLGWDTISPSATDEKYFIHSEGYSSGQFGNFTYPGDQTKKPARHGYLWLHFSGGYEILKNFWVTGWVTLSKLSLSNSLLNEPFNISAFPQVIYTNFREFEGVDNNIAKTLQIKAIVGTIGDFTYGQGLYFNNFTGLGEDLFMGYQNTFVKVTHMASAYYAKDDLFSLYFYPYKKFFGIGIFSEPGGYLGDRVVPGIDFEFTFFKQLKFYGETGISYVYKRNSLTYLKFDGLTNESFGFPIYTETNVDFNQNFTMNNDTLAALVGIDWNFTFPELLKLKGSLVNQFRYYGRENSDFYLYSAQYLHGFSYFYDVSIDQKYNNQPHNFYINPGEKMGMYFRQEIEINPFWLLFVKVRNEFLWIYATTYDGNVKTVKPYGNDLLSLNIFLRFLDHAEVGAQISNIDIAVIESKADNGQDVPEGLFLQDINGFWLNFYVHYYF